MIRTGIAIALIIASTPSCSAHRSARGEPKPVDESLECKDLPETSSAGGRDKSAIQRTLRDRQSDLEHCFEEALRRNDNARGKVVTRLVIEPNGSVSSACIQESTLEDGDAVECILDELQDVKFGRAKGQVTIVHPLSFHGGG